MVAAHLVGPSRVCHGADMTSEERISELETKISELKASQDDLYKQLATAEREQWQGRIDQLELQAHLGAVEANDRVQALSVDLRSRWESARAQLGEDAATASAVTDTLRSGLEGAIREVREALLESAKKIRA